VGEPHSGYFHQRPTDGINREMSSTLTRFSLLPGFVNVNQKVQRNIRVILLV